MTSFCVGLIVFMGVQSKVLYIYFFSIIFHLIDLYYTPLCHFSMEANICQVRKKINAIKCHNYDILKSEI